MARGGARANAGRKQGKPNALNAKARERAAASGLLPLDYLLSIVRNDSEAQDVRIDAAKAAAPYLHARLASIDMTSKTDYTHRVISDRPLTEDEWTEAVGVGSAVGATEVPR